MSDAFGIGQAVQGAARVYFQTARASGRTVAMVESLKEGDRVIFNNSQLASCWNTGAATPAWISDEGGQN